MTHTADRVSRGLLATAALAALVLLVGAVPGVRPHPGPVTVLDDVVQPLGYVAAAAAALVVAARASTERALWWLVAAALTLRAYGFVHTIFVLDRAPVYPSLADAAWIGSSVLLVMALVAVGRRVRTAHGLGVLGLDAMLAGLTVTAVATTLLDPTVDALVEGGGLPVDAVLTNLAYPMLDVASYAVIAGLLVLHGWRLSPDTLLLALGVLCFAVVDAWFLYLLTTTGLTPGNPIAPLSLVGTVAVASAGVVPSSPARSAHGQPSLVPPVVLAVTCVMVLAYDSLGAVSPLGNITAACGVVVAIARAFVTLTGDRRASAEALAAKNQELLRFRALVEASADYIGIGTLEGQILFLNPAARRMTGMSPDEPLEAFTISRALTDEAAVRAREVEQPQIRATGSWQGESALRNQSGTGPPVPVYKNTFVIRDEAGEPWLLGTIQRDITELNAARGALQQLADERQELLRHLVDAQEAERSRIAADVHDDQVQVMAAVDLQLGLVQRQLESAQVDSAATLALVEQMRATVAEANDRLRYLLFDLDSPAQREDVETALGEAAAYVLSDSVRWDVRCEAGLELDETARVLVYRIAKEAMVNVRKHAAATRVRIDVRRVEGGVEVVVADDGVGLPPGDLDPRPGHRGVPDMRDRAAIAGGAVTLGDGPDGGTVVRLWIPVSAKAG